MADLLRCPYCHKPPVFRAEGMFWMGGCDNTFDDGTKHLTDAVMQPIDMLDEAYKQWNQIVLNIREGLKTPNGGHNE